MNELPSVTYNGVRVVYIPDVRLTDESRIEGLAGDLITMVNRSDVSKILLSFKNVKFMGSAMIGKIIELNRKWENEKVDFRICDLNENLLDVFRLMKLDKLFRIYATEDEAVEDFARKKKGGWFS